MTRIPLLHGDYIMRLAQPGRWFKAKAPISCGVFAPMSPVTFPAGTLLRVDKRHDDCAFAHTGDGQPVIFGLSVAVHLVPVVLDGDEVVEQAASA